MSRFGSLFASLGSPVMKHFSGEPVTVTSPDDESEEVTAVLGDERTEEKYVDNGTERVRRRTVSTDPADVTPAIGWTVVIAGEVWTVVETESYTAAMIRVVVERPEPAELAREGYRGGRY